MPPKANLRSTAIKRILQEHKEFERDLPEDFVAAPLEDDLFDWHITMRGAEGSDYQGGIYHARLVLPPTYPLSPPDIQILTPSGRFETQKNICIDGITSFHTGSWRPVWGIRTVVVGLGGFWNAVGPEAEGGYGGLKVDPGERRRLAGVSGDYVCATCSKSNKEIMREHEEALKNKKEQQDAVVDTAARVDGHEAEEAKENTQDEVDVNRDSQFGEDDIGKKTPVDPTLTEVESSQEEKRETVTVTSPESAPVAVAVDATEQHPALTPLHQALLHPYLSHPLLPSPLKLYLHILRILFVPASTLRAHHHPDKLDGLLILDTLIWVVGTVVVLVLGLKLGKHLGVAGRTLGSMFKGRTGAVTGGAGTLEAVKRLRRAPNAARQPGRAGHVHPRRNGIRTGANAGPTQEPGLIGRPAGAGAGVGGQEGRPAAGLEQGARVERRAARAVAEEGTLGA